MKFRHLSPILWTQNLQETISFYEDVLGFRGQSNFPDFVSLQRDQVEIMFIVPKDDPERTPPYPQPFFQKPALTGSVFIYMENVDEFWNEVNGKAKVLSAICDRKYGMRDFAILDNNGYELVFGQDITIQKS